MKIWFLRPREILESGPKRDIHIPKGAIVAVMVKGEIWDITDPSKRHWQPCQCLELKVGKDGMRTNIQGGIDI